ncbi:MAG TPA: hypothetical protein VFE52_02335 [Devosia sp.]|jgi:hypothetical protein|nr:hypothetical protein [Devosia sp.]
MTKHRTALALILVAVFAVTGTTPSLAKPNNGAYQRSAEALKKQQHDIMCAGMRDNLTSAEANADERAGTKAAAKWAKIADQIWDDANQLGCSWAQ